MAVTDPDAKPHRRASMFIVPVDAPGVNIVRDVPNMEHPEQHFGMLGGHAEILYEGVRLGPDALLGEEGDGFLIAQHRLVPGRIHHCMRWLGVARRAFDMLCERSVYRPVRGGLLARQADRAELDRRLGRADAGRAADDAARGVEDRHVRLERGAHGRLADQVLRRAGAPRRRRPRAAGARRARLLDRHAARAALPLRTPRAVRRRRRRGAPRVGRAPDPARRTSAPEDEIPTEYVPARREAARLKFAGVLDTVAVDG